MEGDVEHDVTLHVRRFEEAEEASRPAREKAERDRDYTDGKQWTSTEEEAMRKRGQPVVTFNRIQRKVNYLKGMEAQTRKDPKAFPRTPGDDGSSQAVTDALRYVCDDTDWDVVRSEAFETLLVEGTGVVFVGAKNTRNGIDPDLRNIPWDRFWHDPYSRKADFSDAAYLGLVTWMDEEDAERKFPDGKEAIETTLAQAQDTQTYDDRPKHSMWADYKRKRVRIIEEYYLEKGEWYRCVFTKAGYLEDPAPSPYNDEDGRPECPIKARSLYVDRDNNRYGEVRAMISPQDEVNKRRSKGLHLINSRQTRISRNAGLNPAAAKRELAKPDGVIIADDGEVEILQTGDMAAANFQMLQEAKAEIDLLGPNAALSGKNENASSGKALLAQQQGGMVEVANIMDCLRQLSLSVYRSVWARIRQYWDGPRWIRVTDDERNLKFVGLNQPKTMLDMAKEKLKDDPQAEGKLQMLSQDPMANQVMEIQNPVAELDVDITIDEGMDTPTVAAEQFDTLSKMMPAMTQLPPEALEVLVTASSLRDKDKILEIIQKMKQPPPNPQAEQEAEAQKQIMLQDAIAQINKTNSETERNIASAEASRAKAGTDLMTAQANVLQGAINNGAQIAA